jgi:hypothetical protein
MLLIAAEVVYIYAVFLRDSIYDMVLVEKVE